MNCSCIPFSHAASPRHSELTFYQLHCTFPSLYCIQRNCFIYVAGYGPYLVFTTPSGFWISFSGMQYWAFSHHLDPQIQSPFWCAQTPYPTYCGLCRNPYGTHKGNCHRTPYSSLHLGTGCSYCKVLRSLLQWRGGNKHTAVPCHAAQYHAGELYLKIPQQLKKHFGVTPALRNRQAKPADTWIWRHFPLK